MSDEIARAVNDLFGWDDRKRLLDWYHDGRSEAASDGESDDLQLTYGGLVAVANAVALEAYQQGMRDERYRVAGT